MSTILITGATDGLGRALANRLGPEGHRLILHGRDETRLRKTADDIAAHTTGRPETVIADLAELEQVRRLAAEVRGHTDHLDVLVSNAGIGSGEPDGRDRRVSADGYELRFAVNYLAGFLLTVELLPVLQASTPARIVNVASLALYPLDLDDLMLEHGYSGIRAYGQSKLAQIISGFTLADRLPAEQVTVNSLHPSTYMPTKMVLEEIGHHVDSLEDGVAATHFPVADPALDGVTGRFFDRTREARANDQAYDRGARATLWRRSLELVRAARPQIVTEHDPRTLRFDREYLQADRSDGFVLVRLTLESGRSTEVKRAFCARVLERLIEAVSIREDDVAIVLVENDREDWSFGRGQASYLEIPKEDWR